ncbi:MAG TPA: hypothetical protein VL501_05735 [Pyrinomonadaceae bacterium]|jgi:hypothetical protein|nr:hypothetical protein [Pyrinomonadaceae bacterium]
MPSIIKLVCLILAMLSCGVAAFSQDKSIASAGTFNGQAYSNSKLGFSILVPGGWTFYDASKNQAAIERNKEIAAATGDARLQTSAKYTEVLFQAIPPAFGGQDKQAILSAGAEKLDAPMTTGQYASFNKSLVLERSNAHLTKDASPVTYDGQEFIAFDVEGTRKEGPYRQRYLMTVRHQVAIFIVATFFDDRQEKIVAASLKSINFK